MGFLDAFELSKLFKLFNSATTCGTCLHTMLVTLHSSALGLQAGAYAIRLEGNRCIVEVSGLETFQYEAMAIVATIGDCHLVHVAELFF